MKEDLITYKITIDPEYSEGEDLGIAEIAYTANPAIKVKGMAYHSHIKKSFSDNKKYRITAPALIPMEIYRNDEDGEYYVEFTESEIESLFVKFMSNLNNSNKFNLEHDTSKKVPSFVLEAWLVENPKEDKAFTTYGIEVPKGTLMITSQFTDKEYYEYIVKNDKVGYSIEGFLGLKLSAFAENKKNDFMEKIIIPDGKHQIGDKIYVFSNGLPVSFEEIKEGVKEEVLEGEIIEEEVKEQEYQLVPEEVLAIVQPKLDEIYGLIADLKNSIEVEEVEEVKEEMKLSIHQKFANIANFIKNKK